MKKKVRCLICEKEADRWVGLEGNFAMCLKCYDIAYPYMVKAEVEGRGDELLCPKKIG